MRRRRWFRRRICLCYTIVVTYVRMPHPRFNGVPLTRHAAQLARLTQLFFFKIDNLSDPQYSAAES